MDRTSTRRPRRLRALLVAGALSISMFGTALPASAIALEPVEITTETRGSLAPQGFTWLRGGITTQGFTWLRGGDATPRGFTWLRGGEVTPRGFTWL